MKRKGNSIPEPWLAAAICAGLAALVWFVFGQTVHFDFLNYDDNLYVFSPRVRSGISISNIAWAFTHPVIGLWSPVTVISHMLDCQLFRISPGGHHFMNVLFHGAAAVLLFLAVWRLTGAMARSGFVAALFAIHPLRVESVAWIAERKDVLDAFFFALVLLAYANYARKPTQVRFLPVALFLALGMMAKPMLATVPLVLLLLDYWPLKRLEREKLLRLISEKLPLFFLAGAVAAITMFGFRQAPHDNGVPLPLPTRLANGLIAATVYLGQMFYPADAGVIHCVSAAGAPISGVILSGAVVLAISIFAVKQAKSRPWLPMGWFWYLAMLIPVSGLTYLGLESRADRYTYLPQIGLYIALTWLAAGITIRHRQALLGTGAAVTIALLAWTARTAAAYWKDSETLWTHTLACTSDNLIAEDNMADVLMSEGRPKEAISYCLKALALGLDNPPVMESLGAAYYQAGDLDDALAQYQKALSLAPNRWSEHDNLGMVFAAKGEVEQAMTEYHKALALAPGDATAWRYLGDGASQLGQIEEAEHDYRQSIAINPYVAEAHDSLGVICLQKKDLVEADRQFEMAVRLKPDDVNSLGNLAMLLASAPVDDLRNGARALEAATRAASLPGGDDAFTLGALAAAYAEVGRFPEAISTAQRARQVATDPKFARLLDSQMALYKANTPYHDESLRGAP